MSFRFHWFFPPLLLWSKSYISGGLVIWELRTFPAAITIHNLDPEDSHIFKLAFRNKPSMIITSDHDFDYVKALKPVPGLFIYTPREFMNQFQARTKKPPTKPIDLQFGMNPLDFQPPSQDLDFGRQI